MTISVEGLPDILKTFTFPNEQKAERGIEVFEFINSVIQDYVLNTDLSIENHELREKLKKSEERLDNAQREIERLRKSPGRLW